MLLHRMAKRFMSRTKPPVTNVIEGDEMLVVDIGWNKLVLTNEKALQLAEILQSAEIWEEKYIPKEQRKDDEDHTYHVYINTKCYPMRIVSDGLYQMAKLAGRPVVQS